MEGVAEADGRVAGGIESSEMDFLFICYSPIK